MFKKKNIISNNLADKDAVAQLLKTNTKALEQFESVYFDQILNKEEFDTFFSKPRKTVEKCEVDHDMISKIVNELIDLTSFIEYDGKKLIISNVDKRSIEDTEFLTAEEINSIDIQNRPQLTGNLYTKDLNGYSFEAVLTMYNLYLKEKNEKMKQHLYGMFRQGLDILDLDSILYEMLSLNKNAMGYWLPCIIDALNSTDSIFTIPKTKIIKVPMTLLQLTRLEYSSLNWITLKIVNEYCKKVFDLDSSKDYFVKTGTYSSKFDFRNAHVIPSEVEELGEYLLFIQYQANQLASPLNKPCFYGVSTTNEWVVREFIKDKENNPTIYKGLPLHTEYRIFVDCDTDEVLTVCPYWEPEMMKKRFGHSNDSNSPHNIHDYIIFKSHEDTIMQRYNDYYELVLNNVKKILPKIDLSGQWSIDVMQNGEDFYIIDMGSADLSALSEFVPKGKLKVTQENWIPELEI